MRSSSRLAVRFRRYVAGAIGLLVGGVQGALFGIAAVTVLGAVAGGIIGVLLGLARGGKRKWFRSLRIFPGIVVSGAACGVVGQAFYLNFTSAANGLYHGAAIGLASGMVFFLVVVPLLFLTVRNPGREGSSAAIPCPPAPRTRPAAGT